MIRCLLIGQQNDIQVYSEIIAKINYFGDQAYWITDNPTVDSKFDIGSFDAFFFVSPISNGAQLFREFIKAKNNIYFVDQPTLAPSVINQLLKLADESHNLLYPEIKELNHPLVQDFVHTTGSHLLFRYSKDVSSKKQIRPALLNALSFITLLSPMQVKKVDINSIETTTEGRPAFKIRLKMFDSSIAYIILKLENKNEHSILLESKNGNFIFNFTKNYLENIHGARFMSDLTSDHDLIAKSLESFALCIIMNKKPLFTFYHYSLAHYLLDKFERILLNSF